MVFNQTPFKSNAPTNKTPDILTPGQNINPIFLSLTETFTQNFILQPGKLQPKIKSKFLHQDLFSR